MRATVFRTLSLIAVLALAAVLTSGCTKEIGRAIEHRNLTVQAEMSDTIFLDPVTLSEHPQVYVRVTNTSDLQEIDFGGMLAEKLRAKGYELVPASKAAYILQANLLYLGEQREGMTAETMAGGGFGGALLGAVLGSDTSLRRSTLAGMAGAAIGSAAGAAVGAMFHVDSYVGAVDVQLKELVGPGAVTGTQRATVANGSSTTTTTSRRIETSHQEYRTRIAVSATQTNIDRDRACRIIADRLAAQIAGIF